MYLFPDKPISRNYKTKEKSVTDFIIETFPKFIWTVDKMINGGISKRRPDLLLELKNQILIIEIDENQHNTYEEICENKRLMEISQDVNHKSVVFIKFNPDGYKNKDGKKIPSCWKSNKLGIFTINNKKEWNERLEELSNTVKYWLKTQTNKTIEIIRLYYDY
jgi:hypothetical protein